MDPGEKGRKLCTAGRFSREGKGRRGQRAQQGAGLGHVRAAEKPQEQPRSEEGRGLAGIGRKTASPEPEDLSKGSKLRLSVTGSLWLLYWEIRSPLPQSR